MASNELVVPTSLPQRGRLLSKGARRYRRPLGKVADQGQALRHSGWTVETRCPTERPFPECPRRVCYSPGRVIVAAWCDRLADGLGTGDARQIRVRSIVALETRPAQREELSDTVERLIGACAVGQGFHFGELRPLSAVHRIDLRNYFAGPTICSRDERYRQDFPDRLLGGRREMPSAEAACATSPRKSCRWHSHGTPHRQLVAAHW